MARTNKRKNSLRGTRNDFTLHTKVVPYATAALCLAAEAFAGRLSFEEHAAVQKSLSRMHPRMRVVVV